MALKKPAAFNDEVASSRLAVSRRRALGLDGSAGSGTDNIITSAAQLLTIETTATGYLGYINLDVGAV